MSKAKDAVALEGSPEDRRRTPRKKLVIEISEELHERIVSICRNRGQPVNAAVREALERYFP